MWESVLHGIKMSFIPICGVYMLVCPCVYIHTTPHLYKIMERFQDVNCLSLVMRPQVTFISQIVNNKHILFL